MVCLLCCSCPVGTADRCKNINQRLRGAQLTGNEFVRLSNRNRFSLFDNGAASTRQAISQPIELRCRAEDRIRKRSA